MDSHPLRVLLVEDDPDHAELIRRHLVRSRPKGRPVVLEHVQCLADARQRLARADELHALLLDLVLPDSSLAHTLEAVLEARPELPVVVLTSLDDLDFAADALQRGAQDFLVKSEITGEILLRSIRYAIERKAAQRQLQDYAAQLERRNEELRRFAHLMAHEVRNPLNVVSLNLMLARRASADPKRLADALCQAEGSIKSLGELVAELLRFADAENDERRGDEIVPMERVLSDALNVLRETLREGRASVSNAPLPAVRGQRMQLDHLMQNLIGNAVKYRGDAPPSIRVEAEPSTSSPGFTRFRVIDNGLGIKPEDRERVFDMFCRLHQPTRISGTGIGLAFCKRVVEAHGGRIWVEPSPFGTGSAFCFTLPTADVAESVAPQPSG